MQFVLRLSLQSPAKTLLSCRTRVSEYEHFDVFYSPLLCGAGEYEVRTKEKQRTVRSTSYRAKTTRPGLGLFLFLFSAGGGLPSPSRTGPCLPWAPPSWAQLWVVLPHPHIWWRLWLQLRRKEKGRKKGKRRKRGLCASLPSRQADGRAGEQTAGRSTNILGGGMALSKNTEYDIVDVRITRCRIRRTSVLPIQKTSEARGFAWVK